MLKSNIVAGSNVYLVRTEIPFWDPDYVSQIIDPKFLNDIKGRYKVENNVQKLSKEQMDISRRQRRCLYAKNDPCWGYNGKRVISKCINGKCRYIYECNPDYSDEYAEKWRSSEKDIQLYGNPEKLKEYYLTGMISEEEMEMYSYLPEHEGTLNPVPAGEVYYNGWREFTRQDNKGGWLTIVGYRWVIIDNASYEGEELVPIWGRTDTEIVERRKSNSVKKAKRIEKKNSIIDINEDNVASPLSGRKRSYFKLLEKILIDLIIKTINFVDISNDSFSGNRTTILLDNPAELAFVSSYLLNNSIMHGISTEQKVTLMVADKYKGSTDYKNIIVSSTFLSNGCNDRNIQAWKLLSEQKDISKLNISKHDYVNFKDDYGTKRYVLKNLYGVTHVCLVSDDINITRDLQDGLYKVKFVNNGMVYEIENMGGEVIGVLKEEFTHFLRSLLSKGEISEMPDTIEGVALNVQKGNTDLLGIGHLIFMVY